VGKKMMLCRYVVIGGNGKFEYGNNKYWINYSFDYDSKGVIDVIRCISCSKIYVHGEYDNVFSEEV
jgi:hypothetical protein